MAFRNTVMHLVRKNLNKKLFKKISSLEQESFKDKNRITISVLYNMKQQYDILLKRFNNNNSKYAYQGGARRVQRDHGDK